MQYSLGGKAASTTRTSLIRSIREKQKGQPQAHRGSPNKVIAAPSQNQTKTSPVTTGGGRKEHTKKLKPASG